MLLMAKQVFFMIYVTRKKQKHIPREDFVMKESKYKS